MVNVNHLCMECMKDHGGAEICPHCGYREDQLQTAPYLAVKTWLMDRYLVGKIITCDGEGVTYIGWDNILQSPVMIREYLPVGLCARIQDSMAVKPLAGQQEDFARCLTEFLACNRALAHMRDLSALFPTYDIFELNGTAYAVSEYTESITLRDFLHRNGDRLTFDQARTLLLPVVSTLASLHGADLIHGGISPETLYVGKDGKLRFGGFAGSELRSARGALKTQLFTSYAAIEQYGFDQKIGPAADVYAFAAVLYRVLSGQEPLDAKSRMNQDTLAPAVALQGVVPPHAAQAIASALQLLPDHRTATVERFRAEFSAAPSVTEEQLTHLAEPENAFSPAEPAPKGKTGLYTVIAMLATLVVLVGVFFLVEGIWHPFGLFGKGEPSETASLLVISSEPPPSVDTNSKLTKKTPDFVGQALDACQRNYNSYNFVVEYKVYNEKHGKNVIVSQSPAAGTESPLDSDEVQTVTVVISLGSGQIQVPNVENMSYAQALEVLWQAGFSYDSISCNTTTPAYDGVVTKISPAPGSSCNVYSAEIVLYVENPVDSTVSVPTVSEDNREVASIAEPSSTVSKAQ